MNFANGSVRPAPFPVGPPYWDEMWDSVEWRSVGGYHLPNGQKCSMRQWIYVFEIALDLPRRQHRKAWRAKKQVAESFVGRYRVSTVYLGLDHNWAPGGRPLIFETMVFEIKRSWMEPMEFPDVFEGGTRILPGRWYHQPIDEISDRYSTRDEALRGHWGIRKTVRRLQQLEHGPRGGWRGGR